MSVICSWLDGTHGSESRKFQDKSAHSHDIHGFMSAGACCWWKPAGPTLGNVAASPTWPELLAVSRWSLLSFDIDIEISGGDGGGVGLRPALLWRR